MSLPDALAQNPQISTWICFEGDSIIVHTGKVELGQGIKTAIAMITAEELDVPVERIRIRTGSTAAGPNEYMTAGSMSIEGSGSAVRQACAEVRQRFVQLAAQRLSADPGSLVVLDGIVRNKGTNESLSYTEMLDDNPLDFEATGDATPKPFATYRLVGKTTTRVDLRAKVTGEAAYVQDLRDENTLHGRIVRPPSDGYRLQAIDTSKVEQMPGVRKVVVDGSFVGVIATDEYTATRAKAALHRTATWAPDPHARLPANIHDYLMENPGVSLLVEDGTPTEAPIPPREVGEQTISAVYKKPYHMHGSLGPSAATARFEDGRLLVRSHTQGPYVIRAALAIALDMPPSSIDVEHAENAGCYGHNGADDAAMDAAMLARALPGETILLKWERVDENTFEPYSPAMAMKMEASLDGDKVSHWNADIYSQTHSGRPVPLRAVTNLVAAWHRSNPMKRAEARPAMGNHVGIHRNADPIYTFPKRRIVKHLVTDQRVRTSSTRGLGAFGNVFAIESFMDEIAYLAGVDPVDFRLAQIADPRATAVIETVRRAASEFEPRREPGWQSGCGFAFARYKNRQAYAAVAMYLQVNEETLAIRLDHAIIAADAGQVIDRDGLANQLEGGLVQSSSWTLKEAVRFDEYATTSVDWETYPILRFDEVPTVDVHILDHPELPSMGAGEATQGPTPAAIGNAIFNAVGIRLREIPFTADALRAAALEQ